MSILKKVLIILGEVCFCFLFAFFYIVDEYSLYTVSICISLLLLWKVDEWDVKSGIFSMIVCLGTVAAIFHYDFIYNKITLSDTYEEIHKITLSTGGDSEYLLPNSLQSVSVPGETQDVYIVGKNGMLGVVDKRGRIICSFEYHDYYIDTIQFAGRTIHHLNLIKICESTNEIDTIRLGKKELGFSALDEMYKDDQDYEEDISRARFLQFIIIVLLPILFVLICVLHDIYKEKRAKSKLEDNIRIKKKVEIYTNLTRTRKYRKWKYQRKSKKIMKNTVIKKPKKVLGIDKLKSTLFLFFLCFISLHIFAVDYVVVSNTLNVRSEPTTSSKIRKTLKKGDRILYATTSVQEEWVCFMINDKNKGYVSTKYLRLVENTQQVSQKSLNQKRYFMDMSQAKNRLRWCIGVGLGLAIIFTFLPRIPAILGLVSTAVLPILLLWYFSNTNYSMWFIYPSEVGWWWAIGNFILFIIGGFLAASMCLEGLKQIFDWSCPVFTICMVVLGCLWGYDIYLCISAVFHQVPESLFILLAMFPGAYDGAMNETGVLQDRYGHNIEGYFGSNNDFYGNDGKTYERNGGDDTWYKRY